MSPEFWSLLHGFLNLNSGQTKLSESTSPRCIISLVLLGKNQYD